MRNFFRGRRLAAAVIAALSITGPMALMGGTSSADPLNVADLGVEIQVGQAVVAPGGEPTLTWQDVAQVRPNGGTVIRAKADNTALLPQASMTLTVNLGAARDTDYTVHGCQGTLTLGATQVTCTTGLAATTTGWVYIGVKTGAAGSSVTHTATVSGVLGEALQLPLAPEAADSDTAKTNVVANSQFVFLTDGESASRSGAGANQSFTVPAGATNGGGVFLRQYEDNGADSTCDGAPCYAIEARADFVQVGGTPVADSNPFRMTVHYPGTHLSCTGVGGGADQCNDLFFLRSGFTAGAATGVPRCAGYSPDPSVAIAATSEGRDPCIFMIRPAGEASVTFHIALKKDIGFPLLGL